MGHAIRIKNPIADLHAQRLPYQTVESVYPGAMQAILDNISARRQARVAKTRKPEDMEWYLAWERNMPPDSITDEEQILLWMKHNNKAYLRAHTGKLGGQLIVGEELHVIPESIVAGFKRTAKGLAEQRQRQNHVPLLAYDEPIEEVRVAKPLISNKSEFDPMDALEMWLKDHPHHNKRLATVTKLALAELTGR